MILSRKITGRSVWDFNVITWPALVQYPRARPACSSLNSLINDQICIKKTAARCHLLLAERYLKAFPDRRLSAHNAEKDAGYLEVVGRIGRISAWQFVRIVDAIQNLLLTAGAPAAEKVDWAYWRDSARTLSSNHPTIAREGGSPSDESVSGERFKEKRNAPSALDAVRQDHALLLERLAAEIRRRGYSIRTEQGQFAGKLPRPVSAVAALMALA